MADSETRAVPAGQPTGREPWQPALRGGHRAGMTLPNFLIIGAPKSGTTSLYEYLRQHPQILMSPRQEPNFFAFGGQAPRFAGPDGDRFERDAVYRLEDYATLFAGRTGQIAIGEASPRYLFTPGTAARIKALIPEVRLIAILRNPADRALSAFAMRRRDGWEPCATLAEALAQEPARLKQGWASGIYLQRGWYGRQLQEYFELFDRAQIRICLYDDLLADAAGLLADLFGFLGVDPGFRPDTARRFNQSGVIRNPLFRLLWTRTHPLQRAIRPYLPGAVRHRVSRAFIDRDKAPVQFPPGLREQLLATYHDDILLLQELIRRDLSGWLRRRERSAA